MAKTGKKRKKRKLRKTAKKGERPLVSKKAMKRHVHPASKKPTPKAVRRQRSQTVGKKVVSPINTLWFKECLQKASVTQKKIADALNLDPSQVSVLLSGRRRMQMHEAVLLSELLDQPLDAILMNAGAVGDQMDIGGGGDGPQRAARAIYGHRRGHGGGSHQSASVEVSGVVGEGLIVLDDKKALMGVLRGPRVVPGIDGAAGEGVKAYRIQTEGTRFSGIDGGLVYFREMSSFDPTSIGKLSVVQISGGDKLVRVVKRGYQAGRFDLSLLDGSVTHQDVVLESVSPVLWLKIG